LLAGGPLVGGALVGVPDAGGVVDPLEAGALDAGVEESLPPGSGRVIGPRVMPFPAEVLGDGESAGAHFGSEGFTAQGSGSSAAAMPATASDAPPTKTAAAAMRVTRTRILFVTAVTPSMIGPRLEGQPDETARMASTAIYDSC
ncbi:MAG: hypothetical protein HOV68_09360, partial [Streptomycetaceae bacterium]|nr:hypothetical protein [Streptomycetaceae bacterium]